MFTSVYTTLSRVQRASNVLKQQESRLLANKTGSIERLLVAGPSQEFCAAVGAILVASRLGWGDRRLKHTVPKTTTIGCSSTV